jgi:hypothetical protein
MATSQSLMHQSQFVFAAVVGILLLFESRWSAWPRYRSVAVACATLFFHSVVLIGVTSIAIAACLAAPMLAKAK